MYQTFCFYILNRIVIMVLLLYYFQIVVDHNLNILDAYTGWPGCAHDARVLRNSSLFLKAEAGDKFAPNKLIIGDSAYPLKPWLVTPFRDTGNLNQAHRRFNKRISSSRQVVERSIGLIKGRFRRLREIGVREPETIARTILAGCILHNLCIKTNEDIEMYIEHDNRDNHPNNYPNIYQNDINGVQRRNQLVNFLRQTKNTVLTLLTGYWCYDAYIILQSCLFLYDIHLNKSSSLCNFKMNIRKCWFPYFKNITQIILLIISTRISNPYICVITLETRTVQMFYEVPRVL